MKVGKLHDLMSDVENLLGQFDNVTTPEQLQAQLGRMKKPHHASLLDDLDAVRLSLTALREDVLEMNASPDDADDDDPDADDVNELDNYLDKIDEDEEDDPDDLEEARTPSPQPEDVVSADEIDLQAPPDQQPKIDV